MNWTMLSQDEDAEIDLNFFTKQFINQSVYAAYFRLKYETEWKMDINGI